MFRLRRYRLFLVVVILATLTVYHLTNVRNWEAVGVEGLKKFGYPKHETSSLPTSTSTSTSPSLPKSIPSLEQPTKVLGGLSSASQASSKSPDGAKLASSAIQQQSPEVQQSPSTPSPQASPQVTSPSKSRPIENEEDRVKVFPQVIEEFGQHGQGRLEVDPPQNAALPKPHWKPQAEHFPIASSSLIPIPTGNSKRIPRIQHQFEDESTTARVDREQKLASIKEAFDHAWKGYTEFAMPHDELAPVGADFRNPFNGWGATMVDSLDTLLIMGMKKEFEEALNFVKKIDFTTSIRKDIPLFETTIRYLGGLISAYDLTSGKYPILLDKAVELAEILMGAFDTPNRMPITFYYWTPSYASQPHRAGTRVVLAELGSLSVEFTRLAQLTKEAKYYDAIARITNELENWQMNTTLPGMWPLNVDASGCKKPETPMELVAESRTSGPPDGELLASLPPGLDAGKTGSNGSAKPGSLTRRQLDDAALRAPKGDKAAFDAKIAPQVNDTEPGRMRLNASLKLNKEYAPDDVDCEKQGLAAPPSSRLQEYSIGGMADSTYEYLPKEYMLLGGLNDQYRTMYENAMETVREKLLFRPMTETNRDILGVGRLSIMTGDSLDPTQDEREMTYEGSHLSCFAGGMFALGAKIFGIKDDLITASKLTDGCVWAYESTNTGIMPESFELLPCDSLSHCEWNETKWWRALDPHEVARQDQVRTWNEHVMEIHDNEAALNTAQAQTIQPQQTDLPGLVDLKLETGSPVGVSDSTKTSSEDKLHARQLEAVSPEEPTKTKPQADIAEPNAAEKIIPSAFTLQPVLSHEDFVKARIEEERLPPGFASIWSRKYILRPEAIESVFIMYRITGEDYWRQKGWNMFAAIESYTRTAAAHSAISDVTSVAPLFVDTMESFWLAETLKYFYLLFSDPSLISLDDYIFNTEAHPFKRPK